MDLSRTVVRGIVGPLFVGHGTQKLFGWFGGHGLEVTGSFFETLGLRPGRRQATAAGVAETAGGALLTLGAFTPLASGLITGTMITAIRKVHLKNGPWATNGGYEYNAVVLATMLAITEIGPGRPSVDEAWFPRLKGTGWAVAQFAAGAIGSALATSERFNEPAPAPPPQEAQADIPGDPAAPRQQRFVREQAEVPSAG